ncbi:hypothetical protein RUM43_005538 [Polyplax serrata]|uniref:Uncharacterized protein n=1 Tax=Polyplax serrata TaxID=468196 RepID=A0AAN8PDN9_POLSC
MEECGPEEFAQLQYNNVKLQDELDELKKHALFIEENYNSLLSTSSQKEDYIKSLEQQVNSTFQTLKQNKSIIEILEVDNEKYKKLLDELSLANQTLKKELNEELEILRIEAEECRLSHIKIKEENERLLSQLSSKRTENSFNKSVELEDEKLELILLNETLQHHLSVEKAKNAEKIQDRFVVEEDWSPEKSQPTFQNLNVKQQQQQKENLNLREEILEAEIAEKSCLITRLESLLWEKYEENLRLSALVEKLQNRNQSLNLISAVNSDRRTGPVCLLKEIHMNPKKIINSVYMDDMGNETCPSLSLTFLFDGHRVLPKLITRNKGKGFGRQDFEKNRSFKFANFVDEESREKEIESFGWDDGAGMMGVDRVLWVLSDG